MRRPVTPAAMVVAGLVTGLAGAGPLPAAETTEAGRSAKEKLAMPPTAGIAVTRFAANPIIRPDMLEGQDGENINGPSLIAAPPWVKNPLGKYYLYFAHHGGKYIRLAYADKLEGPWKLHKPGVVRIDADPELRGLGHIASPDAVVDEQKREVRLTFHRGGASEGEEGGSSVAVSSDGLSFNTLPERLGGQYLRLFRYEHAWYVMGRKGMLSCLPDGSAKAGPSRNLLPRGPNNEYPRHVAVRVRGDTLDVVYSRIGDAPERLLLSRVKLGSDWRKWKAEGDVVEILAPEKDYEGVSYPIKPSRAGAGTKLRELRDPAFFEENGKTYLLYSVAGESGIAIAEWEDERP